MYVHFEDRNPGTSEAAGLRTRLILLEGTKSAVHGLEWRAVARVLALLAFNGRDVSGRDSRWGGKSA